MNKILATLAILCTCSVAVAQLQAVTKPMTVTFFVNKKDPEKLLIRGQLEVQYTCLANNKNQSMICKPLEDNPTKAP